MISDKEVDFPNIIIDTVGIINSFNIDFEIFPRSSDAGGVSNEYFLLDQIIIKEDMFSEAIFGSISFFDSVYAIDQLKLTSSLDSVYFQFNGGDLQQYRILDITVSSDIASKAVHGPVGTVNHITIRFSSDSFVNKNFDVLFDSDYIGKISKSVIPDDKETPPIIETPPGFDSGDFKKHETLMSGFVQEMMNKFTKKDDTDVDQSDPKPLKADDTYNDIWLKTQNFFYPQHKVGNNLRISQLMNYICEYACYKDNPKAVNFFFWEDLDYWNFRCVESLIKDKDNYKGEYRLIHSGIDENWYDVIVSMEVISDISPIKLYDGGAAFSEYTRVIPDWKNPYRGFVDSGDSLYREQVTYNYQDDAGQWERIAQFSPFTNFIATKYKKKQDYGTVALTDLNYAFYSNSYNAKTLPWWNYYDFSSPHGYLGKKLALSEEDGGMDIKNKKELFNKLPASKEVSRTETEYWQSQFDFCELPGAFLRSIYKDIKWVLTEARTKYAEAKKIKTQYDVYKNIICCDRESSLGSGNNFSDFYALVYAADKIYGGDGTTASHGTSYDSDPGGIYAYSWKEVEIWPRADISGILNSAYEVIEFEGSGYPLPFAFISSPNSLQGKYIPGFTGISGGISASEAIDTRAYNINEILNTIAPKDFEGSAGYQTLTMNPGVSTPLVISSTDRKNYTSYPKKYQMMPVGKFRIISDTCPDFTQSGTGITSGAKGKNDGGMYYGGKIVQMKSILAEDLKLIKGFTLPTGISGGISGGAFTETTLKRPYIFVFDSDNTHDGLCTGDCG